jgi:hypothetical protein
MGSVTPIGTVASAVVKTPTPAGIIVGGVENIVRGIGNIVDVLTTPSGLWVIDPGSGKWIKAPGNVAITPGSLANPSLPAHYTTLPGVASVSSWLQAGAPGALVDQPPDLVPGVGSNLMTNTGPAAVEPAGSSGGSAGIPAWMIAAAAVGLLLLLL